MHLTTGKWNETCQSYEPLASITRDMVDDAGKLKGNKVFASCSHHRCAKLGGGSASIGMPPLYALNKGSLKCQQFKNAHKKACLAACSGPPPTTTSKPAMGKPSAQPLGQSTLNAFMVGSALLQQQQEKKQQETEQVAAEKPVAEKPAARKQQRIGDDEEEEETAEDVTEEAERKRAKVVDGSSQERYIDLERLDDVRPLASSKSGAVCFIYPFQQVSNIKSTESIYLEMVMEKDFTAESTTMLDESLVNTLSKYQWLKTGLEVEALSNCELVSTSKANSIIRIMMRLKKELQPEGSWTHALRVEVLRKAVPHSRTLLCLQTKEIVIFDLCSNKHFSKVVCLAPLKMWFSFDSVGRPTPYHSRLVKGLIDPLSEALWGERFTHVVADVAEQPSGSNACGLATGIVYSKFIYERISAAFAGTSSREEEWQKLRTELEQPRLFSPAEYVQARLDVLPIVELLTEEYYKSPDDRHVCPVPVEELDAYFAGDEGEFMSRLDSTFPDDADDGGAARPRSNSPSRSSSPSVEPAAAMEVEQSPQPVSAGGDNAPGPSGSNSPLRSSSPSVEPDAAMEVEQSPQPVSAGGDNAPGPSGSDGTDPAASAPVTSSKRFAATGQELTAKTVGKAVRAALRNHPELIMQATRKGLREHLQDKLGLNLEAWKDEIKAAAEAFMMTAMTAK